MYYDKDVKQDITVIFHDPLEILNIYDDLCCDVEGLSNQILYNDLQKEIEFLWNEYVITEDKDLTDDAIKLKKFLLSKSMAINEDGDVIHYLWEYRRNGWGGNDPQKHFDKTDNVCFNCKEQNLKYVETGAIVQGCNRLLQQAYCFFCYNRARFDKSISLLPIILGEQQGQGYGNYKIKSIFKTNEALIEYIKEILEYTHNYGRLSSMNRLLSYYKILVLDFLPDRIVNLEYEMEEPINYKTQSVNSWLKEHDLELWKKCAKRAIEDSQKGDIFEEEELERQINDLKNKLDCNKRIKWDGAKNYYKEALENLEKGEYDKVYI